MNSMAPAGICCNVALHDNALLPWRRQMCCWNMDLCACVDANASVRLGPVSIVYARECVGRSFEYYTVRISTAHQTPFQPQVLCTTTRCLSVGDRFTSHTSHMAHHSRSESSASARGAKSDECAASHEACNKPEAGSRMGAS